MMITVSRRPSSSSTSPTEFCIRSRLSASLARMVPNKDVLFDPRGDGVAFRVKELDGTAQRRWQALCKGVPCRDDALLHRRIDQAETVARGDQPEGQSEQPDA